MSSYWYCVDICANVGLNDLNIEESRNYDYQTYESRVGNDASLPIGNKELKTPYDNAVLR